MQEKNGVEDKASKAEMSLDDVLTSIKKMVIDVDPPILDLTDIVQDDGSIVQAKQSTEANDMKMFLHMAQEHGEESASAELEKNNQALSTSKKETSVVDLLKDVATPLIQTWIDQNLAKIVSEIVEKEIKNLLGKR